LPALSFRCLSISSIRSSSSMRILFNAGHTFFKNPRYIFHLPHMLRLSGLQVYPSARYMTNIYLSVSCFKILSVRSQLILLHGACDTIKRNFYIPIFIFFRSGPGDTVGLTGAVVLQVYSELYRSAHQPLSRHLCRVYRRMGAGPCLIFYQKPAPFPS
jgi:hypothetical protein